MDKKTHFPEGVLEKEIHEDKLGIQNIIFGKRLRPAQTIYEYLIEFLIVAKAPKVINDKSFQEMFPVSGSLYNNIIEYNPKAYMGLKRFVFFENSRIDTKSTIDKEAYNECRNILKGNIEIVNNMSAESVLFVLQNILYGFSVENTGRSWFDKNLMPVSANVLFPESLGRRALRERVCKDYHDAPDDNEKVQKIDTGFDFNSYTYMCRGGEIYYLHLLHALNSDRNRDKIAYIESGIDRMLNSMTGMTQIGDFINNTWEEKMGINPLDKPVSKKLGAIPTDYEERDDHTVSELVNFLDCNIQPMEKIEVFTYGLILQLLRMMHLTAAKSTNNGNGAWIMDMSSKSRDSTEIKKLAIRGFELGEETIKQYIYAGIDAYYSDLPQDKKNDQFKHAEDDSYKVFRKLGKDIGIIIPLKGTGMRYTLSETVIKFLVMALVPAGKKVTFEQFLDMMYEHFGIVISQKHYHASRECGCFRDCAENASFLNANTADFAQKLKNCGFLRDLSDATAIVENPYCKEEN